MYLVMFDCGQDERGEILNMTQIRHIHCAQNPIRSFADLKETRNLARNNEWHISFKKNEQL